MAQPQPTHADLATTYRPTVLRWYRFRVAGQDAEDLTQEVMARMHGYAGLPEEEWLRLLYTVRRTVLIDYVHAVKNVTVSEALLPEDLPLPPSEDTACRALDRQELRAIVDALASKSTTDFRTFIRHDVYGEPFEEIAGSEGVTAQAAQQRASRMRRLARRLRWPRDVVPGFAPGFVLPRMVLRRAMGLGFVAVGGAAGLAILSPGHVVPLAAPPFSVTASVPSFAATPSTAAQPTPAPAPPSAGATSAPAPSADGPKHGDAPPPAPGMRQVAGAQFGDHSTVSGGVDIEKDGDQRSPLAQAADCIAKGPSLDPAALGCP